MGLDNLEIGFDQRAHSWWFVHIRLKRVGKHRSDLWKSNQWGHIAQFRNFSFCKLHPLPAIVISYWHSTNMMYFIIMLTGWTTGDRSTNLIHCGRKLSHSLRALYKCVYSVGKNAVQTTIHEVFMCQGYRKQSKYTQCFIKLAEMPFDSTTKWNQRPNHVVNNRVSFQAGVMNCHRNQAVTEKQFSVPIQLPPPDLIQEKIYRKHIKRERKYQWPETQVFLLKSEARELKRGK